ncbi:hypothetical protein F5Y09DRAFT_297189 [Xylaria sp. FL1042]|nr:hypothetical protein F5Y09DRAFT_297189 [Xylaria sp. FL1042]
MLCAVFLGATCLTTIQTPSLNNEHPSLSLSENISKHLILCTLEIWGNKRTDQLRSICRAHFVQGDYESSTRKSLRGMINSHTTRLTRCGSAGLNGIRRRKPDCLGLLIYDVPVR